MSDVLAFAGVGVVRGRSALLSDIDWEVEEGQRWVVLGPNGAGKTTLLQIAAGRMHPSSGVAGILSEVLGAVDVFELRPRIGLASASLAESIPPQERVLDVVVTASYGVVGRWRESYHDLDHARAVREQLEALTGVSVAVRTADSGKLFGSVKADDIADAVKKAGGPTLDKRNIELPKGLVKKTGNYQVQVKLHDDVTGKINFEVVGA